MHARPLLAMAAISLAGCGSTAVPTAITADPAALPAPTSPPAPTASVPGAAMPRVTADGRPVCGNVTMRAPTPPDCDRP